MFRRILSAVTALLIVAGAGTYAPNTRHVNAPMTANALKDDDGNEYTEDWYEGFKFWRYSDHAVVAGGPLSPSAYMNDDVERLDIPAEIDGVPVTAIADNAFDDYPDLIEITIPDSVTSIGEYAFFECRSLPEIKIPDSVTSIGEGAFLDCESLTDVTIPESVTEIGGCAFLNTAWLENKRNEDPLVIVNNILIDGAACTGNVVIPDSVTDISSHAFQCFDNRKGLISVTIPDGITSIKEYTFYDCRGLTKVTIPNSVTSIDELAFTHCSSLTEITIPEGVASIGESAFEGCSSLPEITIPSSVTSIGEWSFRGCKKLTSVIIPDTISSIEDGVFSDCVGLISVTLPDSITSIGGYAFNWCESLTDITLPESVTSIGKQAFYWCKSLPEITIPKGVGSIDEKTFWYCSSKITILDPDCEIYDSPETIASGSESGYDIVHNDIVYHYYNDGIIRGYENSTAQAYAEKWGYTFEAIALEDEEEEWNYGLFRYEIIDDHVVVTDCKETASTVIIPAKIDGLPVTEIGENAFRGCNRLTKVTLPDTITSIGKAAFAACTALTEISLPNGITSIEDNTFEFCTNLKTANIPDSVTSIGEFAFSRCESLASISLPDGITNIGSYAFNYCSSITSVTIPAKIETIEPHTFDACESLTEVTVLNPDCHFSGADCISNYSWTIAFNGTIYGYEDSTAQTFAQTCGYTFIAMDKAPAQSAKYGDANCDGVVSIADATAILQHLGNRDKYALSEQGEDNADVDLRGNGITAADAIAIQQLDAGLVSSLPVSAISYQQKPNP